jgi:hypothetical protein
MAPKALSFRPQADQDQIFKAALELYPALKKN